MQVCSLGWEDALQEGMATHSNTLTWRITRTDVPGGLQSIGSQTVGHNQTDLPHTPQNLKKICLFAKCRL